MGQSEHSETFRRPDTSQEYQALWDLWRERFRQARDAQEKERSSVRASSKRRWREQKEQAGLGFLAARAAVQQAAREAGGTGAFTLVIQRMDRPAATAAFLTLALGITDDEARAVCERADLRPEPLLVDVPQGVTAFFKHQLESCGTKVSVTESAVAQRSDRRPAIPAAVRREVWQRDGGRCVDCGSNERLEYDHIVPLTLGGANTVRNIELRCEHCNRSKGGRP